MNLHLSTNTYIHTVDNKYIFLLAVLARIGLYLFMSSIYIRIHFKKLTWAVNRAKKIKTDQYTKIKSAQYTAADRTTTFIHTARRQVSSHIQGPRPKHRTRSYGSLGSYERLAEIGDNLISGGRMFQRLQGVLYY